MARGPLVYCAESVDLDWAPQLFMADTEEVLDEQHDQSDDKQNVTNKGRLSCGCKFFNIVIKQGLIRLLKCGRLSYPVGRGTT